MEEGVGVAFKCIVGISNGVVGKGEGGEVRWR